MFFLCNWRNLINIKAQKLKKAQNELTNLYLKEQIEYMQNQINKIRDLVKDRHLDSIANFKWIEQKEDYWES